MTTAPKQWIAEIDERLTNNLLKRVKIRDDLGPIGLLVHVRLSNMLELVEIGRNREPDSMQAHHRTLNYAQSSELAQKMFDKRTHAEAVAQAQYTNHLTTFSQVPVFQEGFLVYIAQTLMIILHVAEKRPSILKQLVGKTPKPFKL